MRFFRQKTSANPSAFTLVELVVSVAIAGVLMIGISYFFSSTFTSLFQAQTRSANTQRQFAVNEIIREKFMALQGLADEGPAHDWILSFNRIANGILPFSYIGKNNDNRLVFKDILPFTKIIGIDYLYGDPGTGTVRQAATGQMVANFGFRNFAGFDKLGNTYYVAVPDENHVKECNCSSTPCVCSDLNTPPLSSPTDVVVDEAEDFLYLSDSGNGRILKYDLHDSEADNNGVPILTNLRYPTGLAYYDDGAGGQLFVAETMANRLLKISATNPLFPVTVTGGGDRPDCDHLTAGFCELNWPTALFVNSDLHELFVADSGNGRILKISDPGIPDHLIFDFSPGGNYALDRIVFVNDRWTGGVYNADPEEGNLIGTAEHYDSATKTFANPNRLTAFTNSACTSDSNHFYTNELTQDIGVGSGDKLMINGSLFTVDFISRGGSAAECKENPTDSSLAKDVIHTLEDASGIADGQTVFLTNPDPVHVRIDSKTTVPENLIQIINNGNEGFQTFEIKTYDKTQGLVNISYQTLRIGDGKLGTNEDVVDVVKSALFFPSGVSDIYYADAGEGKIRRNDGTEPMPPADLQPVDTAAFTRFDYVSDFELATEDPTDHTPIAPLEFNKFNGDKILELTLRAKTDIETVQIYKLDAAIP